MEADAIIFDMDGTMWDATSSYAAVWNATLKRFGIAQEVKGEQLTPLMGLPLDEIMRRLLGDNAPEKKPFLEALMTDEARMMPTLGGKPYRGMKQAIEKLAKSHRLFMLSNCSSSGLRNFTGFTGTTHCFEALLTQGERKASKTDNLLFLKRRHGLECPVYVGDTQADCDATHKAGMRFVWASYGFGECRDADATVGSFDELTELFGTRDRSS